MIEMMIGILLFLFAIWLFVKFVVFVVTLSAGILKILFAILAVILWPVSLLLLLSVGLAAVSIPVIIVCGICWLVGTALTV